MPVPVSVTHPKGAGIQGSNHNTLQTEGPFARLAKLKAEQEQQQQQQQQQQQAQQQPQVNGHAKQQDAEQQSAAAGVTEHSIAVSHLDFAYPGLGEHSLRKQRLRGSHSCWQISFSKADVSILDGVVLPYSVTSSQAWANVCMLAQEAVAVSASCCLLQPACMTATTSLQLQLLPPVSTPRRNALFCCHSQMAGPSQVVLP
jgi:hypothetical protein